jgi:hypothetical protein
MVCYENLKKTGCNKLKWLALLKFVTYRTAIPMLWGIRHAYPERTGLVVRKFSEMNNTTDYSQAGSAI